MEQQAEAPTAIEHRFYLPITDEDSLREFVRLAWGVEIPDVQVCPDHTTPWRAFCDAYFARHRVTVWEACVPGDAYVTTEYGPVAVAEIRAGHRVVGVRDGMVALGIVTSVRHTGEDRLYEIRTRNGDLHCNADHRVLVRRKFPALHEGRGGWHGVEWRDVYVRAGEIRTGGRYHADLLVQPFGWDKRTVTKLPSGREATEGFVELCGLILGDGGIRRYKFFIAHHAGAGYMEHYRAVVETEFGKTFRYDIGSRCSWLHSGAAAAELRLLGLGGTAHTKKVPGWVWNLPTHLKIAFLRGYVDGDGTIRPRGEIEWSSCSLELLEGVRHLSLSAGVNVGRVAYRKRAGECMIGGRMVQRGDLWSLCCYEPKTIGTNDPKYVWREPHHRQGIHDNCGIEGARYWRVLAVEDTGETAPVYDLTVEGTDTFTCDTFIVHNSRGLGGKSYLLATLALTEAVTLKADVNVLGGSGEQSANVLKYSRLFWEHEGAPRQLLKSDIQRETRLAWGNVIKSLMASQTSVRGPHIPRLRLDEVDEMDLRIFDAAMGQPMSSDAVPAQTVISSTHHNADGTFTEIKRRIPEKGWPPVYEWCYKETSTGWLSPAEVEAKRQDVTAAQWAVEFDLQEPSPESRAILPEAVAAMFRADLGQYAGGNGEYIEIEPPLTGCLACGLVAEFGDECPKCHSRDVEPVAYATGADWARKVDHTVIPTARLDVHPARVVAFERCQRLPWPVMVGKFDARLARYGGRACHDATGLGDVVDGYLEHEARGFIMVGRARSSLLSEYISAVERGEIESPDITFMRNEHKYASVDDVYRKGHLPDSISAMALLWRAAGRMQPTPLEVRRTAAQPTASKWTTGGRGGSRWRRSR